MRVAMRLLLAIVVCVLAAAPALAQTEATEAAEADGSALFGFVRQAAAEAGTPPEPVEGLTITVTTPEGASIGEATTDAEGAWEVALPSRGMYVVTISGDAVPEGVPPESLTRPITVGQARQVANFNLAGEGGAAAATSGGGLRLFLQLFVDGIKFGLIIAMAAIGLTLIYGTTGLTNFAHGEMVTFGTLLAFTFTTDLNLNIFLAIGLAMIGGALLGGFLDLGLFRPLRQRGTGLIAAMVISIGLSLLLRNILLYVYGGRRLSFAAFAGQTAMSLGPVRLTSRDLVIMAASLIVLVAVALILQRTRIGKAMRAVADNRDLAESSGIDVQRVILVVWMLGGALAALGGVFQGLDTAVNFELGFRMLLLIFAGVTLGGLGTAYGALVGSLVVGVAVQVSTYWLDAELKNVVALFILILILLVRPQGILGRAERIG